MLVLVVGREIRIRVEEMGEGERGGVIRTLGILVTVPCFSSSSGQVLVCCCLDNKITDIVAYTLDGRLLMKETKIGDVK